MGSPPTEISFYLKMLKVLKRKKIPKRPTETPAEFVQRTQQEGGDLTASLEKITALYYRVRFGGIPLTPYEEEETKVIIRDLKKRSSSSYKESVKSRTAA